MENNATELIEFDKNVNYYTKVRKLNDFLVKANSINSPEELYFFDTELKEYIFSDDVVKGVFFNKVEDSRKRLLTEKDEYNAEIQHNTNLLCRAMNNLNFKYILRPKNTYLKECNILIDDTNNLVNILDYYYYPSLKKCINNEIDYEIIANDENLSDNNECLKTKFKKDIYLILISTFIDFKNCQTYLPVISDFNEIYKKAYIDIIPYLVKFIDGYYIKKYIPYSETKKKRYAIDDIINEIIKNPAISIKECAVELCKSKSVILAQVREFCETNNIEDKITHSKGFKAFKKYILSKNNHKVL